LRQADSNRSGIAIVGMGAVFPGAADLDTYWHNLSHGVDAIREVPAGRLDPVFFEGDSPALDRFACRRGGFVDGLAMFDPVAFGMMPVSVAAAEPDQLIALSTAAAAIQDAGGPDVIARREKVGIVIGRGGYLSAGLGRLDQLVRMAEQLVHSLRQLVPQVTEDELAAVRAEFQHQLGPYQRDDAVGLVPNLVASRIANRFDFSGPAYTVDAACASSLIALDHALRLLHSGDCDVVIAGGVHHCHDLTLWGVFSHLGAISASGNSRPFSRTADGLLIGEGTGMMVLKRVADAESHDDRIYAVIRGTGISSDGRESTVMRPNVAGQVLAVRRAWEAARLDPSTIGLIEAHGTATAAGDAAELATLAEVFGPGSSDGRSEGLGPVPIGAVKSMIGHAMPASGVAGLIKAALALHHQTLPPTLHCEDPHPAMAGTRFRPVTQTRVWEATRDPRRAGVNSFGFGGINAHAVLEEHRAGLSVPKRRPPGTAALVLCAAEDVGSLLDQLGEASCAPDAQGSLRLAVASPTPQRVALARKVVSRGEAWRGRMDIWFSPRPLLADGGSVAFLFPGIEAAMPPRLDDVAARFGLPPREPADTAELGRHGLSVFALGQLLDSALGGIGVRPDIVAGHSIGEWNGMVTAGMVRPETAGPFLARLDPAAIGMPGLAYASAGCAAEEAAAAIEGIAEVVVSHDNCPHQSILCGTDAAVELALGCLRARQVIASKLAFRSGFHSPMFSPQLRRVREALALLPLEAAALPLWSATTCEPYPDDPESVRELAIRHLVEPVRFRELVLRLHEVGARAFVQVGIGSLAAFVDDTLAERDHLTAAAATTRSQGLEQLRRVAAALWVEGADVCFDRLIPDSQVPGHRSGLPAAPAPSIHTRPVLLGTPLVSLSALPPLGSLPGASPRPTTPAAPAPAATAPAAPAPAAPAAAAPAPASPNRIERHISVEGLPWLADHCLVRQRDRWPSISDRFPVVPLTTMISWLVERAAAMQPDRVVTRVERIRSTRWLAVVPTADIVLSAVAQGTDQVRVAIEGYSKARVLTSERAPSAPEVQAALLPHEEPSLIGAEELYEQRWMFHGPQFQAVRDVQGICDAGIRGRIQVLDAPGSLLDGAGQLVGYWVMARTGVDRIVLPTGVDSIDLFGSEPPVGTVVDCTARITSVQDTTIRADLDLVVGGRLFARVIGWTEHRFETDDVLWELLRFPEHHLASQVQPGGWVLAPERWHRTASRDLVMRQYLTGPEQAQYAALNPLRRRQWFLGRIAAKDAVRDWLWSHGAGPVFPAEVELVNGEHGEPLVRASFPADLQISLAHSGTLAVAIASEGTPVGIDIELVAPHDGRFDRLVLTPAEQDLLPDAERDRWVTRFWVAKEAVAKAARTGLSGRPRQYEVTAVAGLSLRVGGRWVDTEIVQGHDGGELVVGWTRLGSGASNAPAISLTTKGADVVDILTHLR
jgi:acyl transferase domain-containing protein/4'-phosphopantetheinyl transferase EntD